MSRIRPSTGDIQDGRTTQLRYWIMRDVGLAQLRTWPQGESVVVNNPQEHPKLPFHPTTQKSDISPCAQSHIPQIVPSTTQRPGLYRRVMSCGILERERRGTRSTSIGVRYDSVAPGIAFKKKVIMYAAWSLYSPRNRRTRP